MTPDATERDRYDRDGYLLVKGLVAPATLARLEARFVAIATGAVPATKEMVLMLSLIHI